MNTSIFSVSRSPIGWLVSEGEKIAEIFSSQHWALKGADALAYARHAGTGTTTMVVVRYAGGATVVASRYG